MIFLAYDQYRVGMHLRMYQEIVICRDSLPNQPKSVTPLKTLKYKTPKSNIT